jgi:hypothetical protein
MVRSERGPADDKAVGAAQSQRMGVRDIDAAVHLQAAALSNRSSRRLYPLKGAG